MEKDVIIDGSISVRTDGEWRHVKNVINNALKSHKFKGKIELLD